MSPHASNLGANLLGILSDNSDEVVLQCLSVLAKILNSTHNEGMHFSKFKYLIQYRSLIFSLKLDSRDFNKAHYRKFLLSLLNLFSEEKKFLDNRASLIIR